MESHLVAFAMLLTVLAWRSVSASEADFVEYETGLEKQDKRHHQWQKCWQHNDCKPGYYCRGRWCYPRYPCAGHVHCPANHYCDLHERVCKPGKVKCTSHYECGYYKYCKNGFCVTKDCYYGKGCPYGYACEQPGVCKVRQGFCTDDSHCKSGQCCLREYGKQHPGICRRHQTANQWCDSTEQATCPCVDGYMCQRRWWQYGRCVPKPTLPPTEEPGSGDIES